MLPFDVDPALAEAEALRDEQRLVRRALAAETAGSAGGAGGTGSLETGGSSSARRELERDLEAIRDRLDALLAGELAPGTPGGRRLEEALDERARQLRLAVTAWRAEHRAEELRQQAAGIAHRAAGGGRELTAAEALRAHELSLRAQAAETGTGWESEIDAPATRDAVLAALGTLRLRVAREQLRDGLLLTEQMRGIIAESLPSLRRGEPVLLVGETGGAKTALAEHLSRSGIGREPELVSGYGDITGAQLIGTHELRAEAGATVSAFVPGPLLRAMVEGRPVILDELNAMPAEFLKRLNRILQLRPGDSFAVQEDAGRRVEIAPGFAILATANEQTPHRYRGLDRLSAELVNRFGANTYRVHYPDTGLDYTDFPRENALLAAAAVADARGALPRGIRVDEIERVARAAFISQQVFSGAHGEGFGDYVSTEREIDGRPGLEESVLAPRTLVAILQKVAGSAGVIDLDHALARFVEGVMHREDRRVLALILEGQGFRIGPAGGGYAAIS